jgi:hypothetical protein
MKEPGLDRRHRDVDGRIEQKRSDTLIRTLRNTYGAGFAVEYHDDSTLGDLLRRTGTSSLSDYFRRQGR